MTFRDLVVHVPVRSGSVCWARTEGATRMIEARADMPDDSRMTGDLKDVATNSQLWAVVK